MSLRIDLADSRPFYRPGDQIRGNIILDSKKSEDIAQVTIDFTGRAKVKIRRHDHYTTISHRSIGYYFHLQEVVYDGACYTFQSGTRSWPFSFHIPLQAEGGDPAIQYPSAKRELDKNGFMKRNDVEGLESHYFSSGSIWRGSNDMLNGRANPHCLPGTFEYVSTSFPTTCEARVEYNLKAALKRPERGLLFPHKDLKALYEVVLRSQNFPEDYHHNSRQPPFRLSQVVAIKRNFAASQHALHTGREKSLLNKVAMNIFKPSYLQAFNVSISIIVNRYCRPGTPYQFLLQASPETNLDDPVNELPPPPPPIRLRSYTLRLIARTAVRAKLESVRLQDVDHHAVETYVLLSGKGLDVGIPWSKHDDEQASSISPSSLIPTPYGWLDLSSMLPINEVCRRFMKPTFKTYNISRKYELALEIKLDSAGIKYDVKRENIAITILAEEDHLETGNEDGVAQMTPEHDHPTKLDSKGERVKQDDSLSTDKKQGGAPPATNLSLEAVTEQLPQYKPGNVPVYHAENELSRPV